MSQTSLDTAGLNLDADDDDAPRFWRCLCCRTSTTSYDAILEHGGETGHGFVADNAHHALLEQGSETQTAIASAPAATAEPDMTWQCANCHAVLPVSPIIAERGGPMRCTACDGKGTKHYDRRPVAPTGEAAEAFTPISADEAQAFLAHARKDFRSEGNELGYVPTQPCDLERFALTVTAQATALAALRARVEEWEQIARTNFADYQAANDKYLDACKALARKHNNPQCACVFCEDLRAALAPRQPTGDQP